MIEDLRSFSIYAISFFFFNCLLVTVRSMNSTHSGIRTSNEIDSVSLSDGEEVRS